MNDFERTILERLAHLESEVARLKSVSKSGKEAAFEALPLNATVGKDYVAYRFHCSEKSVLNGRAGTHLLKSLRLSEKPLKWRKCDVDAAWREHTRPEKEKLKEKAAQAISEAPRVRHRSIIKPEGV